MHVIDDVLDAVLLVAVLVAMVSSMFTLYAVYQDVTEVGYTVQDKSALVATSGGQSVPDGDDTMNAAAVVGMFQFFGDMQIKVKNIVLPNNVVIKITPEYNENLNKILKTVRASLTLGSRYSLQYVSNLVKHRSPTDSKAGYVEVERVERVNGELESEQGAVNSLTE